MHPRYMAAFVIRGGGALLMADKGTATSAALCRRAFLRSRIDAATAPRANVSLASTSGVSGTCSCLSTVGISVHDAMSASAPSRRRWSAASFRCNKAWARLLPFTPSRSS